jgi:PAS domain-containing protein
MLFFPENLKKIRKTKGISSSYIAQTLNVSRSTYWLWENNKRIPSYENVIKLANLLKIYPSAISDIQSNAENKTSDNTFINTELFTTDGRRNFLKKKHDYALRLLQESNAEIDKLWAILDGIFSSLEAILYIKDIKNKYILANDSFKKILSLKPLYNVLGKTDYDFYSKESAVKNEKEDEEILITGIKISHKTRKIPGTRNVKTGLVSKYPIMNVDDKITGLICIITDVTELKRSEKIRLLLETALNNSTDAVTITEKNNGNIVFMSQTIGQFFNVSDSKLCFKKQYNIWLDLIHPDDRANEEYYRQNNNYPELYQYRMYDKNKNIHWMEVYNFITTYEKKNYICRIHRFITEQKNLELELQNHLKINITSEKHTIINNIIKNMKAEGLPEKLIRKVTKNII